MKPVRSILNQASIFTILTFVIALIFYIILLPILIEFINQGASVGGPLVALILYSIPIVLLIVIIASLLRYVERGQGGGF